MTEAAKILIDLHFSMEQFKENIMGLLVSEKKLSMFNDLDATIKTAFTKMYNSLHSSSIKATKKKSGGGSAAPGSGFGSKFDPDIQDIASDDGMTSSEEEEKDEVVAAKGGKVPSKKAAEKAKKDEKKKDKKEDKNKTKVIKASPKTLPDTRGIIDPTLEDRGIIAAKRPWPVPDTKSIPKKRSPMGFNGNHTKLNEIIDL